MNAKNIIYITALILLAIGGINWGLIGLFNFNLVAFIFGFMPFLVSLIYIVVAIAAIYVVIQFFSDRAKNHRFS
jgi:uncharacterized protein